MPERSQLAGHMMRTRARFHHNSTGVKRSEKLDQLRCRSDLRSGIPSRHAVCHTEDGIAANSLSIASRP